MKNFKVISFIIIFIASSFILKAQQLNDSLSQKLDKYLISTNRFYKFNGVALIAQHGKIVLKKHMAKRILRRIF